MASFVAADWAAQLPQPMHRPERTISRGLSAVSIRRASGQRLIQVSMGRLAQAPDPIDDPSRQWLAERRIVCGRGRRLLKQVIFAADLRHQAAQLVAAVPGTFTDERLPI